jgi:hypothetical protein
MAAQREHQHGSPPGGTRQNHYTRLLGMAALSFVSMYTLMYAMVDSASDIYNNFNQIYMAGLMTAPMVVIELALMSGMYRNKKVNALLMAVSVVAGVVFFAFIRQQTLISDRQFLRSMIPHHSGAILMCQGASLQDQRIRELCKAIISSQREEIDQMRALLEDTRAQEAPPGACWSPLRSTRPRDHRRRGNARSCSSAAPLRLARPGVPTRGGTPGTVGSADCYPTGTPTYCRLRRFLA